MDSMKRCTLSIPKPQVLRAFSCAPSSSALTIETFPSRLNSMFLCLSVAVINHDNGIPVSVEIGLKSGTALVPVRCQAGPFPARTSANIEYPFIILSGQSIYAILDHPHEKDNVELIAYGLVVSKYIYETRAFSIYRYFGRNRHDKRRE